MLFRQVAQSEGRSQQEIAASIGLPPSRIVELVDRLEEKGWIERRTLGADRRRRELFVTPRGRTVIDTVRAISIEHERAITSALEPAERETLIGLLERIAAAEGLTEGVHPGFADPAAEPGADDPERRP
jgi:DNA-binding MarR family transcriptional regulator